MYYQEKKTIASIIAGILVLVIYSIYGINKYLEFGVNLLSDMKFWATAILIAIVGGIVIAIVVQIVFHIILAVTNEVVKEVAKEVAKEMSNKTGVEGKFETYEEDEITGFEDEMDKLIALKAMRNAYIVVGAGFMIALITLYFKMPPAIMLNITFGAFSLGSLFEGFSQLYFYRKGVKNV